VQIERARALVPEARFVCADMTTIEFEPGSFDAVVAFYSVFNVPLADQPALIGRVAGGRPILAEEHIVDHIRIDPELFRPRPHYMLKVVGMSMQGAGILDGDLVAVHRTPEVRSRQIVVARIEDEVTVKRYSQKGNIVWLLPENSEFEPIRVDPREQPFLIEGVVVGVVRAQPR